MILRSEHFHLGFQGNELLHIETGNHLALGYMEFPPLIGLLAFTNNYSSDNESKSLFKRPLSISMFANASSISFKSLVVIATSIDFRLSSIYSIYPFPE